MTKKSSFLETITGIIMFFLIIWGITSCMDNVNKKNSSKQSNDNYVMEGQDAYLKNSTYIASDKKSYGELLKFLGANNQDAVNRMLIEGKVFIGKNSQKVTVIKLGFDSDYIEVVDNGERGYVTEENVVKDLNNK